MSKFNDLTGQKFNEWTAIRFLGNYKWECRCSCGNIKAVDTYSLTRGISKSCGHDKLKYTGIDIKVGDKFGELTVIEKLTQARFKCQCSCGNIIEANTNRLIKGDVKSCGHTKKIRDLTGQKFGDWTVISRDKTRPRYWICRCSCGNEKSIQDYSLISGKSSSCGHSKLNTDDKNIDINTILDRGNKFGIYLGQKFGEWEVIGDIDKSYKVMCKCSCGKTKNINIYTLKNGKSTSCGHTMNKERIQDLKNRRFGDLTVTEYVGNGMWKCRCTCGRFVTKQRSHLLDGRATTCGHGTNKEAIDLVGKRFGKLTAIEYIGDKTWKCKCECGNIKNILGANLRNGSTVSCGCVQNYFTKDQLIEKILDYKNKKGSTPKIGELASYLNIEYSTIRYHLQKYDLTHSEYIDMSYTSVYEKEIFQYIKEIYDGNIRRSVKDVINPYELDIYLPDLNLAIEFNGNYWHSSIVKDKMYHLNKTKACGKKHIRLIHIFEYEWNDEIKRNKIKLFLSDIISNSNVIAAKRLDIREISNIEAIEFCNKYHLQNGISSKINLGLYRDNELISIMTFGDPRFTSEYQYELLRMATKPYMRIIGGTRKLFKYFIDNYKPYSIVSYCNLAKFYGSSYLKMGFTFKGWDSVYPNYVWCNDAGDTLSRYQTTKNKLLKDGYGRLGNTEDEIMSNLGYFKIYDCGNLKFEWFSK